jgi:hypothetical protein
MAKSEKLTFDKFEVVVDPENLRFDEDSLNTYIQREAGFYDNFGAFLALAEKNLQNKEIQYEKLVSERFVEAKDNGGSDKLAEAKAKSDSVVVLIKEQMVEARYVVNRLKNHLKAWDKNHDNAQSLGHMLRKQLDKIGGDIHYPRSYIGRPEEYEKKVDDAVQSHVEAGFSETLSAENLF